MADFDFMTKLIMEVEEITLEVQSSRNLADRVSLVVDDALQSFSSVLNQFFVGDPSWLLMNSFYSICVVIISFICIVSFVDDFKMQDFKSLACQYLIQLKSLASNHEKLHLCMQHRVGELENEKVQLSTL